MDKISKTPAVSSHTGVMVFVGGPSCIGKTAVIDELIRQHSNFARPTSFTSREPRPSESNNEYIFTTKEHILQMYDSGKVPTIDNAYGHDYAMDLSSILELLSMGKIVIKEVHPSNHNKLCGIFPNAISILMLPISVDDIKSRDVERLQPDAEFYSTLDVNNFDMIIYISSDNSTSDIAQHLNNKVMLFVETKDSYPRPSEVHKINLTGYNILATEFTEDKRITTRNFHTLSKPFFENEIGKIPAGCRCAEIGPGRGWLRSEFKWPLISYNAIELCPSMIQSLQGEQVINADIFSVPVQQNYYDYIVGSLIDPYCHPLALLEIRRLLKPGGQFIFSLPSDIWASGIRSETARRMTVFALATGKYVNVFSFTYPIDSIKALLVRCGFTIRVCQVWYAQDLLEASAEISPAITNSAKTLGLNLSDLPVVDTFVVE